MPPFPTDAADAAVQDARGAGRPWRPASAGLGDGGAGWPPAAYAWDPAYYPAAASPALSSITINANGPGSTNYFNVAGPQASLSHVSSRAAARGLSALPRANAVHLYTLYT